MPDDEDTEPEGDPTFGLGPRNTTNSMYRAYGPQEKSSFGEYVVVAIVVLAAIGFISWLANPSDSSSSDGCFRVGTPGSYEVVCDE